MPERGWTATDRVIMAHIAWTAPETRAAIGGARSGHRPLGVRPFLTDLPVLADSGNSTGTRRPGTRCCRSLCYQGERGFALMSQRWRTRQWVMLSPGTIGDVAKAALVLV